MDEKDKKAEMKKSQEEFIALFLEKVSRTRNQDGDREKEKAEVACDGRRTRNWGTGREV